MSSIIVACDFDGTVTVQDTQHFVLTHYTGKKWLSVDYAWRRFEITTAERAQQQYALVKTTKEELSQLLLRHVELDPYFPSFVTFCQQQGWPLHIVSDGFDFYLQTILTKYGLAHLPYSANRMYFENGRIQLEFLHQDPSCPCGMCGNCKRWVCQQLRRSGSQLIFIGDGLSDRGVVDVADLIFAKGALRKYCQEHGIPCWEFNNFADVMKTLRTLFR